ncbi:MAG: choice-of-anchor B family protein [Marinoscillum sp.]|uniref:choice-of-anchor B family protein n=1 Tax=Marinoscillum sp. TaxID=2024838 RepID=UPI0032FD71F0
MKKLLITALIATSFTGYAQYPCENGLADGAYPCNQITLMGRLIPEEIDAVEHHGNFLNDIWGWTDPDSGSEYALVGLVDGVAFVDVTVPTNPLYLGKLQESATSNGRVSRVGDVQHGKSSWRDVKTFNNHAFIVSDLNGAHGMQVLDLTKLRGLDGSTAVKFKADAQYEEFGSAHNIVINEATGFAYVVGISDGGTKCSGGLHVIDINDPKNPKFEACFSTDGYTHDAQCVIYQGADADYQGQEICFNSNEDTFTIVNVDDKDNMSMISRTGYDRVSYTHQGWLSEDHRFFLSNDELDENAHGFNPRTLIWDIEDLDAPVLLGEYYNNAAAIDHNLYTHNGLAYESNYFSGLRVLDMAQVADGKLRERAYFDTYPAADVIEFGGTWSNYPYFESGTIIVSDMNNGLFVLRLDLDDDIIATHPGDKEGCENEEISFVVEATGSGHTYQWQWFNGTTYVNLGDDNQISGAQTNELKIMAQNNYEGDILRCKITDPNGALHYSFPTSYAIKGEPLVVAFNFTETTPGTVQFTNESSGAQSYAWDFGDGSTSDEENPTHTFEYGVFNVTLTATNECETAELTKETFVVTGLDDESKYFNIFPNPSSDLVNVFSQESGMLEIRDSSGKLSHQQAITRGAHVIGLNHLRHGLYFISIQTPEAFVVKKLIIQ